MAHKHAVVVGFLITSVVFINAMTEQAHLRELELDGQGGTFEGFVELLSGFRDLSAGQVYALDSHADFGPQVDLLRAERHGSGALAQDAGLI